MPWGTWAEHMAPRVLALQAIHTNRHPAAVPLVHKFHKERRVAPHCMHVQTTYLPCVVNLTTVLWGSTYVRCCHARWSLCRVS